MMQLLYPALLTPIVFREGEIPVLIVEHPLELRRLLAQLQRQEEGDDGEIILSDGCRELPFSRWVSMMLNPVAIEFNSRKLSGKLEQMAREICEDYPEQVKRMLLSLNELAAEIITHMDVEVSYREVEQIDALIKILGLYIDTEEMSLPEQLIEYIRIQQRFFQKDLFIFYGLHALLTEEERAQFYRSIIYEKVKILLIEPVQRGGAIAGEKLMILDKDLCVF